MLSLAELTALPATISLLVAARILGIGRTTAYALARAERFPCRVIKVGAAYRVPTPELLRLLGLDPPATTAAPTAAAPPPRGPCR